MNNPVFYIIGLLVAVFLFLFFREVLLWYYKINERISIAKENTFLLRKIAEKLGATSDELEFKPLKKK